MKKLLIITFVVLCLCSCNAEKAPSGSATPVVSPAVTENTEPAEKLSYIGPDADSGIYDSMNKFEECVYDINGDGTEDNIVLLTSAQKGSDGEFMWDDSNDWALVAECGEDVYPLYYSHSHGSFELYVSEFYKDNGDIEPVIRLSISSSSVFEIREYRYADNKFSEKKAYNTGAINELSVEKY